MIYQVNFNHLYFRLKQNSVREYMMTYLSFINVYVLKTLLGELILYICDSVFMDLFINS